MNSLYFLTEALQIYEDRWVGFINQDRCCDGVFLQLFSDGSGAIILTWSPKVDANITGEERLLKWICMKDDDRETQIEFSSVIELLEILKNV